MQSNLAGKTFVIDYSVEQQGQTLIITASHNSQPIAADTTPWPIKSRPPMPSDCMYWVGNLHVKAIRAVADAHGLQYDQLKDYCPIGTITWPDGTEA